MGEHFKRGDRLQQMCWRCDASYNDRQSSCDRCEYRDSPTPLKFGNYVVEGWIGGGRHSEVWRCVSPTNNEAVAVKQYKPEHLELGRVAISALESQKHIENLLVKIYHTSGDDAWAALEYMPNGNLDNRREKPYKNSSHDFYDVAISVAGGLIELHSRKILHTGIKLTNILFDKDDKIRFTDVGVHKAVLESLPKDRRPAEVNKTFDAPEVETVEFSPSSDIHSLGVALCILWYGRAPFEESDYTIVNKRLMKLCDDDYFPATSSGLPRLLRQMIDIPNKRMKSAAILRDQLVQLGPHPQLGNTLDAMKSQLNRIYGNRATNQSSIWILIELGAALQGLVVGLEHPNHEYSINRCRAYFPRVFAWIMALYSSLNWLPSALINLKYPGYCPNCSHAPCRCDEVDLRPRNERKEQLVDSIKTRPPVLAAAQESGTFEHYYEMFDTIYGGRDADVRTRWGTPLRSTREAMLRLLSASREIAALEQFGNPDRILEIKLEAADLIAWFYHMLRDFSQRDESYMFAQEFATFFGRGCYKCNRIPCTCELSSAEERGADWRVF